MAPEFAQTAATHTRRHGGMFDEMQREDFLALAAALRRFSACQADVPPAQRPVRHGAETRLALVGD